MIHEISPEMAFEKLQGKAYLIDVREAYEVEELAFKVANQMVISLSVFETEHITIPKDAELIMACKAGVRSLHAAEYLAQMGYDPNKIYNLTGGMMNWLRSGLETESW